MDQVKILCSTTWGGNDYIPEVLPHWIGSSDYIVRGLFDDNELLSICTLQIVTSSDLGYISGLRTKDEHRRKGHGKTISKDLMETARRMGVTHLLYLTINFNDPSMRFAEHLGFSLRDQYGSFHMYKPWPSHPTPSPALIPIKASPERIAEVIESNPSFIPNNCIPFDFQFYQKSIQDLQLISERTTFHLVVDGDGQPGGLYYGSPIRADRGERRTSYIVYSANRSIFVDLMARIVDELPVVAAP